MEKLQLLQFVDGKLTDPEKIKEVFDWIEKNRKNKRYLIHLKNIQSLTVEKEGTVDLDYEFDLVKKKITPNIRRISIMSTVLKYAAVFLAIIGLTWIVRFSMNIQPDKIVNRTYCRVYCPYGEIMKVTLSDATTIWLNSGSTISYPNVFDKFQRVVSLKGEAFFKVKSDKRHPFIVNVDKIKVRVTGTEFNIDAYPQSHSLKTTLVRGKVDIYNARGESELHLRPEQMATYDKKSRKLSSSTVDASKCFLWREGEFVFQNASIEEIAEKLSYWYNVRIIVKDESVRNLKISFTALKNRPLEDVLNSMQFLFKQISYKDIKVNDVHEIVITKKRI